MKFANDDPNVTLTIRLIMQGKVRNLSLYLVFCEVTKLMIHYLLN